MTDGSSLVGVKVAEERGGPGSDKLNKTQQDLSTYQCND